jgi:acetyltransferase-like isoleucine patch superfamily enzyme
MGGKPHGLSPDCRVLLNTHPCLFYNTCIMLLQSFLQAVRYRVGGRYQHTGQLLRAAWYRLFFSIGPQTRLAKGVRLEGRDIVMGRNVKLEWGTTLIGPVTLGDNCYINQNSVISQQVTIGNNVGIGAHTLIYGDSREVADDPGCRAGKGTWQPVVIEDGAMIGARVTIMQGVRIGKGCVIATGAVVLQNCEPNCVYAGIPAKKVKTLNG